MTKKLVLVALAAVMIAGFAGCTPPQTPVTVEVDIDVETDSSDHDYAKFSYEFNQDVTLDSVKVTVPGYTTPTEVQNESGFRADDDDYDFHFYWLDGEEYVVPSGAWTVQFWGSSSKTDERFNLSVNVIL